MTNTQIAWVAGLFEGEGSIHIRPTQRGVVLSLSSTDLDILNRLQELTGGLIRQKIRRSAPAHWKPVWEWKLHSISETKALLNSLLPYFGERRACKTLDALDQLDRI